MALFDTKLKTVQIIFLLAFLVLLNLCFLYSPGTGDVGIWISWAQNGETHGLIAGYKENGDIYPPLASLVLFSGVKTAGLFGISPFVAIKLTVSLFLFLTAGTLFIWTRDIVITVIAYFALFVNSIALGYIDTIISFGLILSLWSLKEEKMTLFALLFSITCLTKWQPLIIAPFIALYLLNINQLSHWKQIEFKNLLFRVVGPALLVFGTVVSIYGFTQMWESFSGALKHTFLSGYALNLSWIITHLLHAFYPHDYGGLVDGQASHIVTTSLKITLLPKILFWLTYLITLGQFYKRNKSFDSLIQFSLVGYLVYFSFNTGVHENHLFLASVLAILLYWLDKKHCIVTITIILMCCMNLIVFYGINGRGLLFSTNIAGKVDITLLFSLFNVCFISFFWFTTVILGKDNRKVSDGKTSHQANLLNSS